ncbi:MAG: tetratricopeptide repeat protein [Chitinophagales bacterium]|nr:tetratricopeptide repeat protein [Chitinophagales bacterium]
MKIAEQLSTEGQYVASNDSLNLLIKRYGDRKYDVGEAYYLRSYNHLQLGNIEAAKVDNEASMMIREVLIPEELGKNLKRSGRIAIAEEQYELAIKLLEEAESYPYMDEPEIPAQIEVLLGDVSTKQSNWEKARTHYSSALEILEIINDEPNLMQADILLRTAKTWVAEEDWPQAISTLLDVLEKSNEIEGGWDAQGDVYLTLGEVNQQMGNYWLAERRYYAAYRTFVAQDGLDSATAAKALSHLTDLKSQQENKK